MKKLIYSGAGLLLIAVAFVAFNLLAGIGLGGARLDFTEQKLYTISDGTRQILGELDEPINLYFFYSDKVAKDLPALRTYAQRVEEMLKAYQAQANGKIRLHIIDPSPSPRTRTRRPSTVCRGFRCSRVATRSTSAWRAPIRWMTPRSFRSSPWIRRSTWSTS